MNERIDEHWTLGGTGITNFDVRELSRYEKAVAKYGDPHLIIHHSPFGDKVITTDHSLHDLNGHRDLESFWAVWDRCG